MGKGDLSTALVLRGLKTRFVGRNLLYYPSVTSTMEVSREVARKGAEEGTAVLADEQTGGRGRLQRSWLSPPGGGIAVSVLLRPQLDILPRLGMVASLAAAHSIERVTGLKTGLKWPNDILIRGKKVCGILSESELDGSGVAFVILGIGINVNFDLASYPEISDIATSLLAELGWEVPRWRIVQVLLGEIEQLYRALQEGEPVHREWHSRLETLGKVVQVRSGDLVEEGYAESVDDDGSLLLRRSDGSLATIVGGDVALTPS